MAHSCPVGKNVGSSSETVGKTTEVATESGIGVFATTVSGASDWYGRRIPGKLLRLRPRIRNLEEDVSPDAHEPEEGRRGLVRREKTTREGGRGR